MVNYLLFLLILLATSVQAQIIMQKSKPAAAPKTRVVEKKVYVPSPQAATRPAPTGSTALLIKTDMSIVVYLDGEKKGSFAASDDAQKLSVSAGKYLLSIKATDGTRLQDDQFIEVKSGDKQLLTYHFGASRQTTVTTPTPAVASVTPSTTVAKKTAATLASAFLNNRQRLRSPTLADIGQMMIPIAGGSFQMGSATYESDGRETERPQHSVTVDGFTMSRFEVTVGMFALFVSQTSYRTDAEKEGKSYVYTTKFEEKDGVNWRYDASGTERSSSEYDHPVLHVSHNDAVAFCQWLSDRMGKRYRLPTEAEWEYAAGNGSRHSKYSWGDGSPSGTQGGNVADETARTRFSDWKPERIASGYTDGYAYTAPVGMYAPNELGLYDMSGNVLEWCSDWYDKGYYAVSPSDNPTGPSTGTYRVLRGGCWYITPAYCRSAYRDGGTPSDRDGIIGFRVVSQSQ